MSSPWKSHARKGSLRSTSGHQKQPLSDYSPSNKDATSVSLPKSTPTKTSQEIANVASPSTKGLRQMSIKICEKVRESGKTTSCEVADTLIQLIKKEHEQQGSTKSCDEKNVRRRTYDALNVLEAVNVIAKDNKDITWRGMPSDTHHELRRLVAESDKRKKKIKEKQEALREQLIQQASYRSLVLFNKRRAHHPDHKRDTNRIAVPLIVISANPEAVVHCDASRDMSHLLVDVNAPFAIHDENSILRQMGLSHQATLADLKEMVPEDMIEYCQSHGMLDGLLLRKRVQERKPSSSAPAAKARKHASVQPRAKRVKPSARNSTGQKKS